VRSVALLVQIYLQTNHVDLAVKEIAAAKRWAQDSLLFNLAESWVGLKIVRKPAPSPIHSPLFCHVKYPSLIKLKPQTGRRKVSISLLRLRRTRLQPQHGSTPLYHRPSRSRDSSGPPSRGRSSAFDGHREVSRRCGVDCEHDRVERFDWQGYLGARFVSCPPPGFKGK
jgi:hypothetical protein